MSRMGRGGRGCGAAAGRGCSGDSNGRGGAGNGCGGAGHGNTNGEKQKEYNSGPLDPAYQTGPDHKDPRWEGWPCCGNHSQIADSVKWTNGYGELRECARCALPLLYIPRKGYTGRTRGRPHPKVVEQAANDLKEAEGPVTNNIFKNKIKEIEARKKQLAMPTTKEKKATNLNEPEDEDESESAAEDSDSVGSSWTITQSEAVRRWTHLTNVLLSMEKARDMCRDV